MRINKKLTERIRKYVSKKDIDTDYIAHEVLADIIMSPDSSDLPNVVDYHIPTLSEILRIIIKHTIEVADEQTRLIVNMLVNKRFNQFELAILRELLTQQGDLRSFIKTRIEKLENDSKR